MTYQRTAGLLDRRGISEKAQMNGKVLEALVMGGQPERDRLGEQHGKYCCKESLN